MPFFYTTRILFKHPLTISSYCFSLFNPLLSIVLRLQKQNMSQKKKFERNGCKYRWLIIQKRSPRILLASWRSFDIMVTLLAWIAQRFVSSKRETRYASAASWRAKIAWLWNLISCLNSVAISLTNLWKGSFLINKSVWISKKKKKECGH